MHHHLQVSGLAQQMQPESHTVVCLTMMSLGSIEEWSGVGGEVTGGGKMQSLSSLATGLGHPKEECTADSMTAK